MMAFTRGKSAGSSAAEPQTGGGSGSAAGTPIGELEDGRRLKTGLTGTGGFSTPPSPTLPSTSGLHAKTMTPGPVVQSFLTLGRYQLLSRLAVGGMAEVYLARQGELSGFKTLVVVKKVLPHLASKPDFIAMFLDEARIASMLDHPNVVRINEVGRTDTDYFIAMELVQGKALAAILQQSERAKTPLPHAIGALIVANAAAGLHHAHQLTDASGNLLHLVHRDVSPQNIMVSFEGAVKVIDFGIARALGRLGDTSSGSLKGKLGYMAPEQARGEAIDARADIFSLGVVLWECVAGRRLFLRENELATLRAVVYEPIPKVSHFTKVDRVLEVIIEHALERNLEERFQTAEEMRIALERWVFASGGTSSHDIATLMKAWFPSDHVQWQRAARLALDMQESDPPIDMAFPDLASGRGAGSRTGTGRPGSSGSGNRNRPEALGPGASPMLSAAAMPTTGAEAPPHRRTALWIAAAALAATAALVGMYWHTHRPPPAPVVTPVSVPAARPTVEIFPAPESTAGTTAGAETPRGAQVDQPAKKVEGPTPPSTTDQNPPGKRRKHAILRNKRSGSDDSLRPNPF